MAQSETEVQACTQSERIVALEAAYAHVATKSDIADMRTEVADLTTNIASLRTKVTSDIETVRSNLKNMPRMIGAIIAAASVAVAGANLLVTLALRT
ncbi:MAG: hypothetical protein OXE52_12575 [Chloroflexi bacterium]|nr:hypothetical protein [Chloroflexota bacterium]